jgi:hypothetical protein
MNNGDYAINHIGMLYLAFLSNMWINNDSKKFFIYIKFLRNHDMYLLVESLNDSHD